MIHRKVIVSMIQKVLIGDYDMGRGRGLQRHRAEDMLVASELASSFPLTEVSKSEGTRMPSLQRSSPRGSPREHSNDPGGLLPSAPTVHRMSTFSIADVDKCSICGEEKSRGIFCNTKSTTNRHFTCIDCFLRYVQSLCEDVGKLQDKNYSIYCPAATPALGCTSACWENHRVTSALLAANDNAFGLDNKAILDKFVTALSQAAVRGIADETRPVVNAITDAMCLRCPLSSCSVPLDPQPEGCMAMRCAACGTYFCFLCNASSDDNDSCHAHVRDCELNPNPGDYFVEVDRFERVRKDLQVKAIREVLSRMCNPDMNAWRDDEFVMRVLTHAGRLLRGSNLQIENILPVAEIAFDGYFDGLGWQESMSGLRVTLNQAEPSLEVLERAFGKLSNLVRDGDEVRNQLGLHGCCELGIEALKYVCTRGEVFVVKICIFLLCDLSLNNARNKDKLIGAIDVVVDQLTIQEQGSTRHHSLTNYALIFLWNESFSAAGLRKLRTLSLIPLLDYIISAFPDIQDAVWLKNRLLEG